MTADAAAAAESRLGVAAGLRRLRRRGAGDRGRVRGFRPQGAVAGGAVAAARPRGAGGHQHELPAGRRSRAGMWATRRVSRAALFQPGGGQPDRRGGPGRGTGDRHGRARPWRSAQPAASSRCAAGTAGALPINRFFCPYTNEAARALDDGLGSTAEIDAVAREVLGAAAGPFAVMNLIKPRINLHAIRNLAPLGTFYAPAAAMIAAGEADRPFPIARPTAPPPERRARSPTGCCAAASCRCCRRSTRKWPSPPCSTWAPARR